ncbi:MAG: histidinol-phosphate transaminase, partial [Pseudomonadota bacterium]
MIAPVPTVRAMASYALADLGEAQAISLAQNESAHPPSPKAIAAAQTALAQGALYPDPDWHSLRAAIAATHPVDPRHILCGAGSMELIGTLIRAFAGPGDDVLGTQYGYLFVATACQQAGATYRRAAEPDLRVDVDCLLAAVTPQTRIVFLCNPGNPTGTRLPNADIIRLRNALPQDVLLVVDQAYAEFDDQDHAAIFDLVTQNSTCVTRTLSKAYGLAGARVGWGAFPRQIGDQMRKLLNPNNIPGASQAMATAALADQTYMQTTVRQTAATRDRFANRLRAIGLHVPTSHTNFVLIRFADDA